MKYVLSVDSIAAFLSEDLINRSDLLIFLSKNGCELVITRQILYEIEKGRADTYNKLKQLISDGYIQIESFTNGPTLTHFKDRHPEFSESDIALFLKCADYILGGNNFYFVVDAELIKSHATDLGYSCITTIGLLYLLKKMGGVSSSELSNITNSLI